MNFVFALLDIILVIVSIIVMLIPSATRRLNLSAALVRTIYWCLINCLSQACLYFLNYVALAKPTQNKESGDAMHILLA
jgi:hypothetical protein